MPIHTVETGDCISSIAFERGHFWETVWNDAANSQLKDTRKDPNVLLPGDLVTVPPIRLKKESGATEVRHRFRLRGVPAKLRLRVLKEPVPTGSEASSPPAPTDPIPRDVCTEDPEPDPKPVKDEPCANVPCTLDIDGKQTQVETDRDGMIECSIPPNARRGRLIVEPGTERERVIALSLGHLDPITEFSGIRQRLCNLGFACAESPDAGPDPAPDLEAAVRAFQEKHGLTVSGDIDQNTRDQIKEAHGA